ncbi:MAG TPA: tetratricopeptide repeat protein [Verrucomicrobiae bacterium]
MKQFLVTLLILSAWLTTVRAQQDTDGKFISIYTTIQQADALQKDGHAREALASYQDAQIRLEKFSRQFPDWNPAIIQYRTGDLADKIKTLQAQLPPPVAATNNPSATTVPAAVPSQANTDLLVKLQMAQDENTQLQAKLKEALAMQPNAVDAAAQEQIRSLMKENDLLKASSGQGGAPVTATSATAAEMASLRARLAVYEAKPTPYSDAELAMLRLDGKITYKPKTIPQWPAGSAALVASAQQHFSQKEYDLAEADYHKILQIDPNNSLALGNLAAIEMEENKFDAAEKDFKTALAQDPEDAYTLSELGVLKIRQEKYDAALDYLSQAAMYDPKNSEIQNHLGVVLSHKGQSGPAESALRKALELDPNSASAHNNLAVVYLNENPPSAQLARWHYEKAIAGGEPRNPDLEKMLAEKGAPVSQ